MSGAGPWPANVGFLGGPPSAKLLRCAERFFYPHSSAFISGWRSDRPGELATPAARSSWYEPASPVLLLATSAASAEVRHIKTSDGVDLFVTVKGHGTPCLYLHGGPGSGSHWAEKFWGEQVQSYYGLTAAFRSSPTNQFSLRFLGALCVTAVRSAPMRYTACATAPTPASTGCAR